MQPLELTTPGLLFPALSLVMLAYTNRFLTLASLVRHLVSAYRNEPDPRLRLQIKNLRLRIALLRYSQAFGVLSLLLCTGSIFALYWGLAWFGAVCFAAALLLMAVSLLLSLREIMLSGVALNAELDRVEGL